eukprot:12441019-Prorocentrum_lima.AAC.1
MGGGGVVRTCWVCGVLLLFECVVTNCFLRHACNHPSGMTFNLLLRIHHRPLPLPLPLQVPVLYLLLFSLPYTDY